MSSPDQPSNLRIDQSQQSGGLNLGAYNSFQELKIGDVVAGNKVTIQTFQLILYTGAPRPADPAMRADLLRAYRSEVALRYAVWRRRYATLPMVVLPVATRATSAPHYEREELFFVALRRDFAASTGPPQASPQREASEPHTFTDLREGLARYSHLILLGPPGGGKTTALWRLALDLAEAGLSGDEKTTLPIFVRLGGLQSGQSVGDLLRADLATAAFEDADGLRFPLEAHRALAGLLDELLLDGQLTLLWDGLNEVPRSRFVESARALDAFRREHPGRLGGSRNASVTTCRTDDHAQLLEECGTDPYPVQGVSIQGLDGATIRQVVTGLLGAARGAALLDALARPEHATLATLARTPLLLTMLCEVYDTAGELPRNRGQLLQRFVARRWGWEQERRPEGWITAEVQEQALARLAYTITASAGRGTAIPRPWAEQQLRAAAPTANPAELVRLGQAADLLESFGDGSQLRFSHQLVQEYFAAIALRVKLQEAYAWRKLPLVGDTIARRMLDRYARPSARTGWEETLLLLVGIAELADAVRVRGLINIFVSQPLQAAQLLAASGAEVDPALRDTVRAEALRQIAAEPFDQGRRLDAGRALGLLGDPRFPVSDAEWRRSLDSLSTRLTGEGDDYWRYVPAGRYRIGGWEEGQPSAEHALAAFWVARLPVTMAQFARFVVEGYRDDSCWTANGLAWRKGRREPDWWSDPQYSGVNQPVVWITWYEATAFCRWLSAHLKKALPAGYTLRLPTEAEWEVAAAYAGPEQRRPYPWGEPELVPERAVYDAWKLNAPAPVGLCPAGAAACGALDMAGNVWEWTSSSYRAYPEEAQQRQEDFTDYRVDVAIRGGAYYLDSTNVRCGARLGFHPVGLVGVLGFRVVLAPQLAQMS